mmetsp:Transcript_11321/g.30903  ORF Transcript_11321/g.30903 Transcript_11321/m.30903 type:complete len:286 (-) Transcript_11321:499-1356(-)
MRVPLFRTGPSTSPVCLVWLRRGWRGQTPSHPLPLWMNPTWRPSWLRHNRSSRRPRGRPKSSSSSSCCCSSKRGSYSRSSFWRGTPRKLQSTQHCEPLQWCLCQSFQSWHGCTLVASKRELPKRPHLHPPLRTGWCTAAHTPTHRLPHPMTPCATRSATFSGNTLVVLCAAMHQYLTLTTSLVALHASIPTLGCTLAAWMALLLMRLRRRRACHQAWNGQGHRLWPCSRVKSARGEVYDLDHPEVGGLTKPALTNTFTGQMTQGLWLRGLQGPCKVQGRVCWMGM